MPKVDFLAFVENRGFYFDVLGFEPLKNNLKHNLNSAGNLGNLDFDNLVQPSNKVLETGSKDE